ncbi:MAG: MFS transporter [Betaproteobacteria bacterium]|nr:MFS transporter [Betaproteobacteria bacterium]
MNRNLWLLAAAQGLFLTNNVLFVAVNGLVGLSLASVSWMATLPILGYVVGGAISTGPVARSQMRWGRKVSFQIGLVVAFFSALLAAYAVYGKNFWLLVSATVIAGYYSANGQLYRFAAAELAKPEYRERAVSMVLAGGIIGGVFGPNLAQWTQHLSAEPFAAAYGALAVVALVAMGVIGLVNFPPVPPKKTGDHSGRPLGEIIRQPVFIVSTAAAALGYGVMNILMAASPIAMQMCGHPFKYAALVLEWHVIGMFAPGFFTGRLIHRYGTTPILAAGVALNVLCVVIALSGETVTHFLISMFLVGVGWNFLFTAGTALSLKAYRPEEKDKTQAAINFCVFVVMAITSFSAGALVTTSGWTLLNYISLIPIGIAGLAVLWYAMLERRPNAI